MHACRLAIDAVDSGMDDWAADVRLVFDNTVTLPQLTYGIDLHECVPGKV